MGTVIFGAEGAMQLQWVRYGKKIEEYVRNQLQEELEYDQMTLKEYIDPFTGEPVQKGK